MSARTTSSPNGAAEVSERRAGAFCVWPTGFMRLNGPMDKRRRAWLTGLEAR